MGEIVLDQIEAGLIWSVWPHMAALFRRACDRVPSQYTPELILARALTAQCDLWAIYDRDKPLPLIGAASTACRGKLVIIEELAGERLGEWKDALLARFEDMARRKGFQEVEIGGRLGWSRLLRADGYEPVRITLRKQL